MKFGKSLREKTLKEWRFYSVDYKAMKMAIKEGDVVEFDNLLDESEVKLRKFYLDKEKWAVDYMKTLDERVANLREAVGVPTEAVTETSIESDSAESLTSSDEESDKVHPIVSRIDSSSSLGNQFLGLSKRQSFGTKQACLKDEYRRMGASKEFNAYIYAKKSLATFDRELSLLLEFFELNATAFGKILKKFDKVTGSATRDARLEQIFAAHEYFKGRVLFELKEQVSKLLDEVSALKPQLPEGWESRKTYSIGCFDLFHRGHQNALLSLREFGSYVVVGIHDDESYFKLKNKYTIDNLETRIANVKPYVDQIFVIPSTDPLIYIKSMVSEQDIQSGSCCYARGDDMLNFPGREWVESVMPVHFVPRTEGCSSTLIRTIYHAEDEETRKKAAFAKTRYDGKPIDEDGNVIKLTPPTVAA